MNTQGKYVKLVSKLNRLTKEDKLAWSVCKPPKALREGVDAIWIDFYSTVYAGTELGIGEMRFRSYSDYADGINWEQRPVLSLLEDHELKYEFPKIEGLWNLLETIRYKEADVEDTIESLIGAPDEDEHEE